MIRHLSGLASKGRTLGRYVIGALLLFCAVSAACHRVSRSPSELVERGDRFAAEQKYNEAIIEYRGAIQQAPKLALAHTRLGDAYVSTQDTQNFLSALYEYAVAADLLPDSVDAQLKAGEALLLARRYEDARTRANRALAKEPRNVNALILKGNATAGLNDIEHALEEMNDAIKAAPDDARSYASLGVIEMNKGHREEAEAAFKRAVEVQPRSRMAQLALANFYWSSGRLADAEGPMKRAVEIDPGNSLSQQSLATLYLAAGRVADAEVPLRAAADTIKNVPSRLRLADYYLRYDRADAAIGLLKALATENDGFAPATIRLAEYDRSQNRRADADRSLDAVLAREPANAAALVMKARFLLADGKVDEALARAKAAVAANRRAADAQYLVGTIDVRKGSIDEAIAAFLEVRKLNLRVVQAIVQLAQLYLEKGDVQTALEYAKEAVLAAPKDGPARLALASASAANGEENRAHEIMTQLLADYPDMATVHLQAARLAIQQKDRATARREFARTMALEPASIDALRGSIGLDLAEKKFDHARTLVDERLRKTPRDSGLNVLAADLYSAMGDPVRQEALLRLAIDADSGNVDAFSRLAVLYLRQHKLDEAKAEYERVGKDGPKSVAAQTMVGMILEVQNKPADAQQVYEKVVAAHPEAGLAANNLAWLYAEHGGNLDVALQLALSARRQLPPLPQIDDTLGWIYYKKDLTTRAIPALEASTQQDPKNPTYQFHLGLAYAKAGDRVRALTALDAALREKPDFQQARAARDAVAQARQP